MIIIGQCGYCDLQSSLSAEYFVVQLDCFARPHDVAEVIVICAMSGRTLE